MDRGPEGQRASRKIDTERLEQWKSRCDDNENKEGIVLIHISGTQEYDTSVLGQGKIGGHYPECWE